MTIKKLFYAKWIGLSLCGAGMSCQPKRLNSDSSELTSGESDQKKKEVKKHLEDFLKWLPSHLEMAKSHFISILGPYNPYVAFGKDSPSSASLDTDSVWDPIQEFSVPDRVSSIPVPKDAQEFAVLNQSLKGFALKEQPEQKKKVLNGLIKGLYDSLNCHSPIRGIFVYAATDNLEVNKILGASRKFGVVPSGSHWSALTGKLKGFFPGVPFKAVETSIAGGFTFDGGDVTLMVKVVGPRFLGLEYLRVMEYSVRNGPKHGLVEGHEMVGAPLDWIAPNTRAGFAWNNHEGSVLVYQEISGFEVGVQILFSGEKFKNLGNRDPNKCAGGQNHH